MDMFTFGKRLKECRKSKNVSAIKLGEIAGVRSATIHRYENGEFKSIKQDKLEAMANYLGVDINYLVGNSNDKYNTSFFNQLSQKQNIEINNVIYFAKDMFKEKNVTLNGTAITKEDIEYLINSLEITLEILNRKHKGGKRNEK